MSRVLHRVISILFFTAFLVTPSLLLAFSNNNVRVDRFKWLKVQTDHFDIYYDSSTARLVPRMAHYLEKAWWRVGQKLNYEVKERTPFFFYSNHNEFEQTNVVPIGEGTGGVTEAFKNRFLIFNDGSERWMKHVIFHEFGHVVQFNVLYGGFWKSIRLLKSPFYPLWMMEGMAEYVSGDIDTPVGNMIVRDAVYHKQLVPLTELQGFSHLKPNQVTLAYKTGEASMQFLADEYGREKIGELLVVMESHFDVSSALSELLGTDLFRFDFRFREWLDEKYMDLFQKVGVPTKYGPVLSTSDDLPQFIYSPVFSPDGKKIYFFSDRGGPTQLYELDLDTKKETALFGTKWGKLENIHSRGGRGLTVSKGGRWLAFAGEKKQRDFLYVYDLKKKKLKKYKVPFDQIRSPRFSPVGNHLVVVGMERGFNDLYIISRKGKRVDRLTDNPQDESDPVFSTDGSHVIYSGEVLNEQGSDPAGRDLFSVSLGEKKIQQLTKFKGAEKEPLMLPDGTFLFVRTQNDEKEIGINLHRWTPGDDKTEQLTNLVGGAFTPVYHKNLNTLVYVGFNAGERLLYQFNLPDSFISQEKKELIPIEIEDDFDLEEEAGKSKKMAGLPLQQWADSRLDTPTLWGAPTPYKFDLSTDLFLPFFFYSTQDGLVAADIWQFSDTLGNHQVQQQMQYASRNDFVDFAAFYTYARFRPRFTIGGQVERFYRDFNRQRQRKEVEGIGLITYPLDRINSVSVGVGATDREDLFFDHAEPDADFRARFWLAGFAHDTVTGRYLMATRGRRLSLFYQEGVNGFGGNQQFKSGGVEGVQYFRLPRESAFATRAFYGRSVGAEPQVFRLGGVDRVRGVSRASLTNKKQNVALASGELRLRISYLHARTRFLFPDFFFKAAYLILFNDIGYGWDNRTEREAFEVNRAFNAAGAGIAWPTFILQSFQLNLSVLWSRRTDIGRDVWYVTVGSSF